MAMYIRREKVLPFFWWMLISAILNRLQPIDYYNTMKENNTVQYISNIDLQLKDVDLTQDKAKEMLCSLKDPVILQNWEFSAVCKRKISSGLFSFGFLILWDMLHSISVFEACPPVLMSPWQQTQCIYRKYRQKRRISRHHTQSGKEAINDMTIQMESTIL